LEHNTLIWATRDELRHDLSYGGTKSDAEEFLTSTLIARSLLKNQRYQERFVSRFCELMNSELAPARMGARFDRLLEQLTPHLAVDRARWPGSKEAYVEGVQGVRRFIAERPSIVFEHFQERFSFAQCRPYVLHDPRLVFPSSVGLDS
jgi:hypothetical protein